MRVGILPRFPGMWLLVAALAMPGGLSLSGSAGAQGRAPVEPYTATQPTTLVVFADHSMEDREWQALFTALRTEVAQGSAETSRLDRHPVLLRGDAIKPGMEVNSALVVYLHGDCGLTWPPPGKPVPGKPLGWTLSAGGRIEPFAHVDCTEIGQVLGPRALAMGRERRNSTMAGAMARVILHEWIHIATQSPAHTGHGISKAEFNEADLNGDNQDRTKGTDNSR